MSPVTVRVFASHPVAAAQYTRLLEAQNDFALVKDDCFQVGVFDAELPFLEAALNMAAVKSPSMRALLVGSGCDENECVRWLSRGVWGLVTYDRYEEELPRAVRQLAEGRLWFPAPVVIRWMRMDALVSASTLGLPLTPREREVMELVLRRLSNKEIGAELRISERTVKFHVGNIFHKLHVSSRKELSAGPLSLARPA